MITNGGLEAVTYMARLVPSFIVFHVPC